MGVKKLDWKLNEQSYINTNPILINDNKEVPLLYPIFKRFIDLSVGIVGLIISLPILILISIIIKIESPGPIFFIQERVGLNGKLFNIYKFRSMRIDAEKNGPQWAKKNDSRITKVGQFIRKTRIDEIPQFVNILSGDMSLIGPRPERKIFTEQFNKEIPGFSNRLAVKPGLTGWAQVNGGYDISPAEKLNYDLFYIHNQNIILDIVVLVKTVKVVFTGDGAR